MTRLLALVFLGIGLVAPQALAQNVLAREANLRATASKDEAPLLVLLPGTEVARKATPPSNGYYSVDIPSLRGFLYLGQHVKKEGYDAVIEGVSHAYLRRLPCKRDGAGLDTAICMLVEGTRLSVVGREGRWLLVELGAIENAYIHRSAFGETGTQAGISTRLVGSQDRQPEVMVLEIESIQFGRGTGDEFEQTETIEYGRVGVRVVFAFPPPLVEGPYFITLSVGGPDTRLAIEVSDDPRVFFGSFMAVRPAD